MGIKCFWIEPTDNVALWLRRFTFSNEQADPCPLMGYHNAMFRLPDAKAIFAEYIKAGDKQGVLDARPEHVPVDDPRWPERCGCGYVFGLDDCYAIFQDLIYDNNLPLREQPIGAMYDCYWWPGEDDRGPDGKCLVVILPGLGNSKTEWMIDRPSRDGAPWTRSGQVPLITVSPSVDTGNWHGHLRNGELIPC